MDDMNPDVDFVLLQCCLVVLLGGLYLNLGRRRGHRRWWVRPINQRRVEQGDYDNLLQEMRNGDPQQFFAYTRMTVVKFDYLLSLLEPYLTKKSPREPLSPGIRLALTLRYLASGDAIQTIAWSFRIGKSTCHKVIRETTPVIWNVLSPLYLREPTVEDYLNISDGFNDRWNFPNCIGSVDGKHVTIQAPQNTGSQYFNYKKQFSIVLLGICDADYRFVYVDIGAYGSQSDGGIFRHSQFGQRLFNNELPLPPHAPLPYTTTPFPFYLVADEGFPLHERIMRPYSGRVAGGLTEEMKIFNYRLSRAQRTIENAFGILAARWRIFHRVIQAEPDNVDNVVKACICLHNFLIVTEENDATKTYCPQYFVDREIDGEIYHGNWREEVGGNMGNLQNCNRRMGSRNRSLTATVIRNTLASYFTSVHGAVQWQIQHIRRGVQSALWEA